MSMENAEQAWVFRFVLESEEGTPVTQDAAEQLLHHIIEWAEERGYQIGGGYSPPTRGEDVDEPLFHIRE